MFKKIGIIVLVFCVAISAAFANGQDEGAGDESVVLKLGHGITLTHPAHLAAEQFAAAVEAGTAGRINNRGIP